MPFVRSLYVKKDDVSMLPSFEETSKHVITWKRVSKMVEPFGRHLAWGVLIIIGALAPLRYSLSKSMTSRKSMDSNFSKRFCLSTVTRTI